MTQATSRRLGFVSLAGVFSGLWHSPLDAVLGLDHLSTLTARPSFRRDGHCLYVEDFFTGR